ncbi:MAG: type I-E CRISPR-associated protein Cas7/Cse4/CasC [Burkholderiaceae bacterium]
MALIAEFHLLQNFAPSNLNRDDTGAPKDAVFGGVRRARISSQCVKRAVRKHFEAADLLDPSNLAERTRNLPTLIRSKLLEHGTFDIEKADKAIETALSQIDLKVKKKAKDEGLGQTEYLLFVGRRETEALVVAIAAHFDALSSGKPGADVKRAITECIGAATAADVALFGRMLADRKDFNVDAAAQVAHAISTHRVDRDVDFFTAVDDIVAAGDAVSGMLGTVEFNSSCYYRYAVVNVDQLVRNLDGDQTLAIAALQAFLAGLIEATPSGKQNSFAAHNPPAFISVSVRGGMAMNLANAFEKPVSHQENDAGLTAASVKRLRSQWERYCSGFDIDGDSLKTLDFTGVWSTDGVANAVQLKAAFQAALEAKVGA